MPSPPAEGSSREKQGSPSRLAERERQEESEKRRRRDRDRGSDVDSDHRRDRDRDERRSRHKEDRDREKDRERRKRRERDGDDERERRKRRERDSDDDRARRRRDKRKDSRSPSPSDRRRRKEAKAASKALSRREAELEHARKLAEMAMYSGQDNPFNDANLGEKFTWHKKQEKEKKAGMTPEEIARKDAVRRREAEEELAKLNKRRAEREVDRALREEEQAKNHRLAEDAAMAEWIAKEDSFLLEQSRRRAGIRLQMQRAKAIDFLAINLRFADTANAGKTTAALDSLVHSKDSEASRAEEAEGWGWADAGFEFEIDEPWRIFDNLTQADCVELEQDIKMYLSLEQSRINVEFWEALLVMCQHQLEQFRNPDRAVGGRLYNKDVDEAAGKIVADLTLQRLNDLEVKTHDMLESGQPVDGEFWDLVLKKIHVQKAIVKLNSIHEIVLKNRLEQFKKRQREDAAKVQAELGGALSAQVRAEKSVAADDNAEGIEAYDPSMSPQRVPISELPAADRNLPMVKASDALRDLIAARRKITNSVFVPKSQRQAEAEDDGDLADEIAPRPAGEVAIDSNPALIAKWRSEINAEPRDWGDSESEAEMEEADLADEIDRAPSTFDLSDKYRPRKPKYFNRVHSSFEWNEYNQSHYDKDNPPPKVISGYRFSIFYPDLIDKTKPPTYHIKPIPGDNDTQLIVFTAGPPYEDIAFRIVKKQWEYSHRRGFRSVFTAGGVLQLYFSFARHYYRK